MATESNSLEIQYNCAGALGQLSLVGKSNNSVEYGLETTPEIRLPSKKRRKYLLDDQMLHNRLSPILFQY